MKAYVLQENNPERKNTRVIGVSDSFMDIIGLAAYMYPGYEDYANSGIFYDKESLIKDKEIKKIKSICIVEFDFGKERETHIGIPMDENDLEKIEKVVGSILSI